jgi:hypothetical protein
MLRLKHSAIRILLTAAFFAVVMPHVLNAQSIAEAQMRQVAISEMGDTVVPSSIDFQMRLDTVNPIHYSVRLYKGCPSDGAQDETDRVAAQLRNRDLPAPRLSYTKYTIDDMNQLAPQDALDMGTRPRKEWTLEARHSILAEQRGGVVQGYLVATEVAEPEPCNCNSTEERDIKIWLTSRSGEDKMLAMVSVLTPRLLARHPSWRRISEYTGQLLRVSGWIYWNGAEAKVLGNDRGSLWEIHPILKIEVADDQGNFRELI